MKAIMCKLGLLMVGLLPSLSAYAYDFEVDGIYYNITSPSNLEVEVTYKALQFINGKYDNSAYNYYENSSYEGEVSIPETVNYNNRTYTVVSIGDSAFGSKRYNNYYAPDWGYGCKVTSVKLPKTINVIKNAAFARCGSLTNIEIPEGTTSIDDDAFYESALEVISLPNTLINIGDHSISETNISKLTIPNSVVTIKNYAFMNNSKLEYVVIGSGVIKMGIDAFVSCKKLLEVFFLPTIKPSGSYSFSGCHANIEYYVPSVAEYGFGKEYISFESSSFDYNGSQHNINWTNNLKAYKCEIAETDCQTDINAGKYTKYLKATYSNGVDFSVEIPYEYTINKAPLACTVNNAEREYGDPNPTFTCNISGYVNGENEQTLGETASFECEATKMSNVGEYRILASLNAPNYDVTYKYGTLSVVKASITGRVVNSSKIYGNQNPKFELLYSGLKNGETSPSWTVAPTVSTEASIKSQVGDYNVIAEGGVSKNYYCENFTAGILSILPRELTAKALDCSCVYGDENPKFSIKYSGFVNDDSESSISIHPMLKCDAAKGSNVGTYAIIPSGGISENYTFNYLNGTLTVNPANLILSASNVSKEYGDANPLFKFDAIGLVNEDQTETALTEYPSLTSGATDRSNVGEYKIDIAGGKSLNYTLSYRSGVLTINKAPLTVIAENAERDYGDNNPTFNKSYLGFKSGDTEANSFSQLPKLSTLATTKSGVGEYEISIGGGVSKNYDLVSYTPGTLTVRKRALTAIASDCERLYEEENPAFRISYTGFVNGDTDTSLTEKPIATCSATKSSNAGTYPISVTGGMAENYTFRYQDGILTVNPLTVGFKNTHNSVTYNDMSISTNEYSFNYVPEIVGPYNADDFWLELWFLDKDNNYDQHVATISESGYAGNYVNTNYDRPMWAGKYIFNLKSKGTNPNVVVNPSRAYLTVNQASNNLEWNAESTISVKVGEKIDLGISYQADLWCTFNTEYDDEIIAISSEGETGKNPHWYATGLKEGETTLYFSIGCRKNEMGFYDFADSRTLSRRIKVEKVSGIDDTLNDDNSISVSVRNGAIYVYNKDVEVSVRVFSIQGTMIAETKDDVINNLSNGIYVVSIGTKSFKVKI